MIKITYFPHGTTSDNERGIASGWSNPALSEKGKWESVETRKILANRTFDLVYCSDLNRAVESANIMFGENIKIISDSRLREVNYGDLTGANSKKIESMMEEHIAIPFPNGESYEDVEKRMREFLNSLSNYQNRSIAIVAHRATQLALDVILGDKTWKNAMKEDWRLKRPKEWKPGWEYVLK